MLFNLNIKNFMMIDEADIKFSAGLNMITGESGSGKSTVIKALLMALGSKSDYNLIKKGKDFSNITAHFTIFLNNPVKLILDDLQIPYDDSDINIVFRRMLYISKRSQIWVNDTLISTQSALKISYHLIDILTQKENIKILEKSYQTDYIDMHLKDDNILKTIKNKFNKSNNILKDIKKIVNEYKNDSKNIDYLKYRYNELKELDPNIKDYLKILEENKLADSYFNIKDVFEKIENIFNKGFEGEFLSNGVLKIAKLLKDIEFYKKDILEHKNNLLEIANQLDNLSYKLSKHNLILEQDESELERSQLRLSKYQDMMRKFEIDDIKLLVDKKNELENKIEKNQNIKLVLKEKLDDFKKYINDIKKESDILTKYRKKISEEILKKIKIEMKDLGIKNIDLNFIFLNINRKDEIILSSLLDKDFEKNYKDWCKLSAKGQEKLDIYVNLSNKSVSISKALSGGEKSRLMLAYKSIIIKKQDIFKSMVFDEIDTGVSGQIADTIGKKLFKLSKKSQIISISHLAQVASYADNHILAENHFGKTSLSKLDNFGKIKEIARLLSGSNITDKSLENAREMIERSYEQKIN